MSYTAFISYDTSTDEQVVVYRLQTLASVSGIQVLLPQRNGRILSDETKHRIDISDSVIAFLTSRITPQVREELAYAEGKGSLIIPIHEKGVNVSSLKNLEWIEYDPKRDVPGDVEQRILRVLKGKKRAKENRNAIVLAGLAIGLLALLSSKE